MHFYDYNTVLQVSKQASTAYGVCEVWKQELSTLIAISYPGLLPLGFLQTTQLISLVVFYLANSERRQLPPLACYWLRLCLMANIFRARLALRTIPALRSLRPKYLNMSKDKICSRCRDDICHHTLTLQQMCITVWLYATDLPC